MSPGKLAAQVSHGSMVWLTAAIKQAARRCDDTLFQVAEYRHPDLARLALDASKEGKVWFNAKKQEDGHIVACDPEPYYQATLVFDRELFENWIQGSFTKVVCEAKNKNQLLKAVGIAQELNLKEGKDYFLIKDNCLTELEPEEWEVDPTTGSTVGRTCTVVGFRPLPAEVCAKISRKFQLYR